MNITRILLTIVPVVTIGGAPSAASHQAQAGATSPAPSAGAQPPRAPLNAQSMAHLSLQVALDRAGFSPGEIDATTGTNTERALRAFQRARKLPETGVVDNGTRAAFGEWFTTPLGEYVLTEQDVAGPFVTQVAEDMMAMATLDALSYASPVEMIAERFHCSPALLRRLNPAAAFIAGERLIVPNVEPFTIPAEGERPRRTSEAGGAMVTVSEASRTLVVSG